MFRFVFPNLSRLEGCYGKTGEQAGGQTDRWEGGRKEGGGEDEDDNDDDDDDEEEEEEDEEEEDEEEKFTDIFCRYIYICKLCTKS